MTCIVCNTKFYEASRMDPAEPCDCGLNWRVCRDDNEMTPSELEDLAKAKKLWAKGQEKGCECTDIMAEEFGPSCPIHCAKCGETKPLKNYNEDHPNPKEEPLMLCDDCFTNECEDANERAQGDAWAGGFADNH